MAAVVLAVVASPCSTSPAPSTSLRFYPSMASARCPASSQKIRRLGTIYSQHRKQHTLHASGRQIIVLADLDNNMQRRQAITLLGSFLFLTGFSPLEEVSAAEFTDMPALRGKDYGKSKMSFPDFVLTNTGLQYKDLREGAGANPQEGDQVVVDWAGYTIGYYGRIFEARNKAKGGSFEGNEKEFFKFKVGSDQVIPAFEEAIRTMRVGGVRRIIVPSNIGYPNNDYNSKGPRPATFSGQRALDFVLRNEGLIDKTLLFDIELLKVVQK